MLMRTMLNRFQKYVWSISAGRCKQLCDWNFHFLPLNSGFSALCMACFPIATCSKVHSRHACHHSLPGWIQQSSRFFSTSLTPQGVTVQASTGTPYQPKWTGMQDLQRWRRDCKCCLFFFPSLPSTSWGCVQCVSEDKRAPWIPIQKRVSGSSLIAFLLTQIVPEICFTWSTGWNFLY